MRIFTALAILIAIALFILLPLLPSCHDVSYTHTLAFAPDGNQLAVARVDSTEYHIPIDLKNYSLDVERTICLVDVPLAKVKSVIAHDFRPGNQGVAWSLTRWGRGALAFAQDGQSLLVLEFGGGKIERFNLNNGQATTFFGPQPDDKFFAYSLSQDRKVVAAASRNLGIWLLDAQNGAQILAAPRAGFGHGYDGPGVGLSADKHWLAVLSHGTLYFLDASAGLRVQGRAASSGPFAFAPEGNAVAIANEKVLSLRNVVTGESRDFVLEDYILDVQFMPDGSLAAAVGNDVVVFDAGTGAEIARRAGTVWLSAIAPSPNGDIIAIGDNRGKLTLWNMAENTSTVVAIPGRIIPPWLRIPATLAILLVCLALAFRYWLKRASANNAVGETSPSGTFG